jgi:hypothetical protein
VWRVARASSAGGTAKTKTIKSVHVCIKQTKTVSLRANSNPPVHLSLMRRATVRASHVDAAVDRGARERANRFVSRVRPSRARTAIARSGAGGIWLIRSAWVRDF